MEFSVRIFFHLKSEDAYLSAKRAAERTIELLPCGATIVLEGIDDTLNGLFAPLEKGAKEVMVGFKVEAGSIQVTKQTSEKLYHTMRKMLGKAFIELPNPRDRIVVESANS